MTVDAVVVGAGPNGLAAAVTLARSGLDVLVLERAATPGGGARTEELTLPGFRHDVCSAVHPLALQSEFFRRFGLDRRVDLRLPEVQYGHPLDGGRAALAFRDLERTADGLGVDRSAYLDLMLPLVRDVDRVSAFATDTMLRVPRHPLALARFGLRALEQGSPAWGRRFRGDLAPAMLAGVAAHAIQPMPSVGGAAAALALGTYAHGRGWPVPVGGSASIVGALVADLVAHGGRIETGAEVRSLGDLPPARAVLFDTSVPAMLGIAGRRIAGPRRAVLRAFRFGDAAAKVDFALSEPVPWASESLREAGTVHVGGTRDEIAAGERDVAAGRHPDSPYVLASVPTVVDPSRAPAGRHVLWAYTHVPAGSGEDRAEAVTRQIERFAPGFRDTVLATSSRTARDLAAHDPNYVGGDIASGAATFRQLVVRPLVSTDPWRIARDGIYLCSQSAAPGPGVHGMAGWRAARSALRHTFGITTDVDLTPDAPALTPPD